MDISPVWFIIGLINFTIIGVLAFFLIAKAEQVEQLQNTFRRLKKSFDDLDEQARLIVKTDLELNKTQEELDKRLNGLEALQKTSRLISTTLDEKEIFQRINQPLITDLGFEKNIIFVYDQDKNFQIRVSLGFSEDDMPLILKNLSKDAHLSLPLTERQTFSSFNSPIQRKEAVRNIFNVEHFVFAPILTQQGSIGFIFLGNRSNASSLTEGDEELVSILANQLGQALENARLFKQVFVSSQELELKVTERTKELASVLEEVRRISKTKSEFISAVSHELRTPLTSIKGYASLLMTGKLGEIPQAVKERLEKINTHSDTLVQFVNNLLDIARIESGKVEMSFVECNLKKIVDNVHDLLTPQLREKNIEWLCRLDERIPPLFLDSHQIERVFINLIGNAVKFTPDGGKISIEAALEKNFVTIQIADTGIGVSEKDIDKLFDEFYRVDNEINQKVKGTGLGLPLAKKIIEAHQGKIWATSELNKGTMFHFVLPIKIN